MRKQILSLLLFFCMGLVATSCSDDDKKGEDKVTQTRISAILPGDFITTGSRVPSSHKLRCILEVWSKGATAELKYQGTVVADPAAQNENLFFDFELPAGSYDCLMWADYIDGTAASSTDKYYDTSDLKNIRVKDALALVNNDACDASFYSGVIEKKEGSALQQDLKLIRPFAKVSILEKNLKEFLLLKGLTASFNASMSFDVTTGKASEATTTVNYTVPTFDPADSADGTVFTGYFFAGEDTRKLGEVHLSFTTESGVQQVVIPDIIPLLRDQHIKVSGNMMTDSPDPNNEFEISFDVEVDDWGASNQDIEAIEAKAKVGDFFYADGSYSSTYVKNEANPCIGVVFAVAHDEGKASGDKPENYVDNSGKQKLKNIRGWVIAAKEIGGKLKVKVDNPDNPSQEVVLDLGTLPGSALAQGKADISGFKNTQVFRQTGITLADYPVVEQIIKYEDNPATKAPEGTSGWYWGAVNQYLILAGEYAAVTVESNVVTHWEYLTVGKSMDILVNDQAADHFSTDGEQFYWSSSVEASTGKIFRVGLLNTGRNYGQTAGWKLNDARHFRPILTF